MHSECGAWKWRECWGCSPARGPSSPASSPPLGKSARRDAAHPVCGPPGGQRAASPLFRPSPGGSRRERPAPAGPGSLQGGRSLSGRVSGSGGLTRGAVGRPGVAGLLQPTMCTPALQLSPHPEIQGLDCSGRGSWPPQEGRRPQGTWGPGRGVGTARDRVSVAPALRVREALSRAGWDEVEVLGVKT